MREKDQPSIVSRKIFCQGACSLALGIAVTVASGCKAAELFIPKKEEILTPEEVSKLFPLTIENSSSYNLVGLRHQALKQAFQEAIIDPRIHLNLCIGGGGASSLNLSFVGEDGQEMSYPAGFFVTSNYSFEAGSEWERLAYDATINLRLSLKLASYFESQVIEAEPEYDEFQRLMGNFMEHEIEEITKKIGKELENNPDSLIFVFAPPDSSGRL